MTRRLLILLLIIVTSFSIISADSRHESYDRTTITKDSTEYKTGQKLFRSNCSICHAIEKMDIVGPTLNNIENRRTKKWILSYTKNDEEFSKTDKDAKALTAKNPHMDHVNFDTILTDQQLKIILKYIKTESAKVNKLEK